MAILKETRTEMAD